MTKEQIEDLIKSKAKRTCKRCNENKTCDNFFIVKSKNKNQYRFNTPCKDCYKQKYQNEDRKKYIKFYLKKRNFGISESEYNTMLKTQNNCCAICGIDRKAITKDFAIDHCHSTGKIRGLLCSNCNIGIGMFNDNIDVLNKAIKYLMLWKS